MAKQLLYLWLTAFLLFCLQTVQAQTSQTTTTEPIPVKALVLEHKLNLANAEDAQKIESFATFLKENYGKGGQVVYLPGAKTYACLDQSPKAEFLTFVKNDITAKFPFVTCKEMDEASFGKKYPEELKFFKGNNQNSNSPAIYLKENVALPGQRRDGK